MRRKGATETRSTAETERQPVNVTIGAANNKEPRTPETTTGFIDGLAGSELVTVGDDAVASYLAFNGRRALVVCDGIGSRTGESAKVARAAAESVGRTLLRTEGDHLLSLYGFIDDAIAAGVSSRDSNDADVNTTFSLIVIEPNGEFLAAVIGDSPIAIEEKPGSEPRVIGNEINPSTKAAIARGGNINERVVDDVWALYNNASTPGELAHHLLENGIASSPDHARQLEQTVIDVCSSEHSGRQILESNNPDLEPILVPADPKKGREIIELQGTIHEGGSAKVMSDGVSDTMPWSQVLDQDSAQDLVVQSTRYSDSGDNIRRKSDHATAAEYRREGGSTAATPSSPVLGSAASLEGTQPVERFAPENDGLDELRRRDPDMAALIKSMNRK